MLKLGHDFKFIDFDDIPMTGIGLLIPEYEGITYHYNKVNIREEGMGACLEFEYTLVYSAKHDPEVLMRDERFHEIMGQILEQVIDIKLKDEENKNASN